ncbi:MAG: hypothetical protein LAQ69_02470 [Acidobacteriia bacterium]|nr:hypothetical protein [Terriglobia bacterium]
MGLTRFFRRSHWDAERAAEIEAYIDIETDDNIARRMPAKEAQRKIGNVTRVREKIYHMNSIAFLETCGRDAIYGLSMLRKNPGFTTVAVVSLALGIGANTAIFSLVDTLLIRSLPAPHPEETDLSVPG